MRASFTCKYCGASVRCDQNGCPAVYHDCPESKAAAQARWEAKQALDRLAGLDLSDLYAPTAGDALALRGGPLAIERVRPLVEWLDTASYPALAAATVTALRGEG